MYFGLKKDSLFVSRKKDTQMCKGYDRNLTYTAKICAQKMGSVIVQTNCMTTDKDKHCGK